MTRSGHRGGVVPVLLAAALVAACGPKRLAVVGPVADAPAVAGRLQESSRLRDTARIDFQWQLNEAGSRVRGVGVARLEPPDRARLDLFHDSYETVAAAAVVGDELRLPPGGGDEVFPPVDLMWATLGVFRPVAGARLAGADRLEDGSSRLRYVLGDGRELHYEVLDGVLRAVELLEGETMVEWVRLEPAMDGRFPAVTTYRNLVEFRELRIVRTALEYAGAFDPEIWDPRH